MVPNLILRVAGFTNVPNLKRKRGLGGGLEGLELLGRGKVDSLEGLEGLEGLTGRESLRTLSWLRGLHGLRGLRGLRSECLEGLRRHLGGCPFRRLERAEGWEDGGARAAASDGFRAQLLGVSVFWVGYRVFSLGGDSVDSC